MANQLGCFLQNLAMITAPLRHLLKKDTSWVWKPEQEAAFIHTKSVLTSPSILSYVDTSLPTALLTDASKLFGMGYALTQTRKGGTTALIQCGSRSLTPAESRYAPISRSALRSNGLSLKQGNI